MYQISASSAHFISIFGLNKSALPLLCGLLPSYNVTLLRIGCQSVGGHHSAITGKLEHNTWNIWKVFPPVVMRRKAKKARDDRPFSALERGWGVLTSRKQRQEIFWRRSKKQISEESDEGCYSEEFSDNSDNLISTDDSLNANEIDKDSFSTGIGISPPPLALPPPDPHNPEQVQEFISHYLRTNIFKRKGTSIGDQFQTISSAFGNY